MYICIPGIYVCIYRWRGGRADKHMGTKSSINVSGRPANTDFTPERVVVN